MAELDIKGKDGKIYTLKVPEGADPETIVNRFSRDMGWAKNEGGIVKETANTVGALGAGVNEGIAQILNLPGEAIAAIASELRGFVGGRTAEYDTVKELSERKFIFRSQEAADKIRAAAKQELATLEKDPEVQKELAAREAWKTSLRQTFDLRNTFKAAGIPVGSAKDLEAQGLEMTPLRTALNRAGQVTGSAVAAGMGPVASVAAGTGALAGRAVGSEVGDIVGAPESGAKIGETIGSITLPLAGFLTSRKIGREAVKPKEREEITKLKESAYARAEQAGVMYSPEGLNRLSAEVATDMAKRDLYAPLHPKAEAAMKRIVEEAQKGQGASLTKLDQMRQTVRGAMEGATDDEISLIYRMVGKIDDFMIKPRPGDVAFGDVVNGPKALLDARAAARKDFNAQLIDDIVTRAENAAGRYNAGGFQTALKNETRKVVNDKEFMRTLPSDLRDSLTKIVRGDKIENTLRQVGRMAPQNIFNAAAVYGAVASTFDAGVGATIVGTGLAARTVSSQMTKANLRQADEVARRGFLPPPEAFTPLERQLLGTILLRMGQEKADAVQ